MSRTIVSYTTVSLATNAVIGILVAGCYALVAAQEPLPVASGKTLEWAIVVAVREEVRANHLEKRKDICLALDNRSAVDERAVLAELKRLHLVLRPDDWCSQGPRGLTIALISPAREPNPGTYELDMQIVDSSPIARGEDLAELIRKGTYTVRSSSAPRSQAITYKQSCCPDHTNPTKR